GTSTVFFAAEHPGAAIVAVEPERNNCLLLEKNCAGLENIRIRQAAIGSELRRMSLRDPGFSDWGFQLTEGEGGMYEVGVRTVPRLLAVCPAATHAPFLCKIDIEGGEKWLFEKHTEWVEQFPLLIIELHDWMLPGQANSQNFLKTISRLNFDFVYRG